MKVTYFLEVLSSWCFWAEPAWAELQRRYAGRIEFQWRIARMRPEDWPVSREQCAWFYRRSGTIMRSPFMLDASWYEPPKAGEYPAASFVAEAARDFGFTGDEIRLALSHAAEREGRPAGRMEVAVEIAVAASGGRIDAAQLLAAARSAAVAERIYTSTREFFSHQITQRPAFVIEDAIGDKAVFSGLARIQPIVVTIDAMLADCAAYSSHRAHFGEPPPV